METGLEPARWSAAAALLTASNALPEMQGNSKIANFFARFFWGGFALSVVYATQCRQPMPGNGCVPIQTTIGRLGGRAKP